MLETTIALISVIALPYAFLILTFSSGWKKKNINKQIKTPLFVSVVVPFRNEERNLSPLLESLINQDYPLSHLEIILADDHSSDTSNQIITRHLELNTNLRHLKMPADVSGKKETLRSAITEAKGEVIITTDADCFMNQTWISKMAAQFTREHVQMVIGPVMVAHRKGLFAQLQELEFFSLVGSTGGAVNTLGAIMCNGANLAFRKEAWKKGQQDIKGQQFASGDDMFLLETVKKNHPNGIVFLKEYNAIVYTQPENTIKSFFRQRIRWASKSSGYSDKAIIFTGLTVAWINIFLALLMTGILFTKHLIFPALLLLILKTAIDFVLLYKVSVFARRKKIMFLLPVLSILYPYYVSIVTLLSFIMQVSWKERKA